MQGDATVLKFLNEALKNELAAPKRFLEDIVQRPVTTMSAPGGMIDDRVVAAARDEGYGAIGSSVELVSGVTPRDDVILDPPDSLVDGAALEVAKGE